MHSPIDVSSAEPDVAQRLCDVQLARAPAAHGRLELLDAQPQLAHLLHVLVLQVAHFQRARRDAPLERAVLGLQRAELVAEPLHARLRLVGRADALFGAHARELFVHGPRG